MARGKTQSVTATLNNKPSTTASKTVELIVNNGQLVPDTNETNPGVFSV